MIEGEGFYAELCASLGGKGTNEAIPLPFHARPAQMLAEWLAHQACLATPEADAAAADPWLAPFWHRRSG